MSPLVVGIRGVGIDEVVRCVYVYESHLRIKVYKFPCSIFSVLMISFHTLKLFSSSCLSFFPSSLFYFTVDLIRECYELTK